MSWQETAALHIKDKDREQFFTKMINKLLIFFSSIAIMILVMLPLFFNILIGSEYISSYKYIPILLYANTWNVLVGLIGGIYVAQKRTKEIAMTTIISAIINILINFLLMKGIGLYAACISTLLAYMIMGIYRYFDCKKSIDIKLDWKSIIVFTGLFIISSIAYLKNKLYLNILNAIIIIVYVIIINNRLLVVMYNEFKKKIS